MSNQGFIALHRGDIAETLLGKHPNAFLLLTQIALRARWKDCPITGMKQGEAFIGDHKNAGIQTEKAYRHAKEILVRASLVSFKGANKGTVATLTDTSIFSTTAPDRGGQGADKGRLRTRIHRIHRHFLRRAEQGPTPRRNPAIQFHGVNQRDSPGSPNGIGLDGPRHFPLSISTGRLLPPRNGFYAIHPSARSTTADLYLAGSPEIRNGAEIL